MNFLNQRRGYATVSCLLVITLAQAQTTIKGAFVSPIQEPVPFAHVLLISLKDSSYTQLSITGNDGNFSFSGCPIGDYFIKCTSVGFKPYTTDTIKVATNQHVELGKMTIEEDQQVLGEVAVNSYKSSTSYRADRSIISLNESNSSSSQTLMDVLKKTPAISIDMLTQEILMEGKSNISIAVNNKPMRLPKDAIVHFLASIPSKDILSIELISNPSSEYDADSGGIINIILRKEIEEGFGGNVFTNFGYGYRKKLDFGGTFSTRHKKTSLVASLNNYINDTKEHWTFERDIDYNDNSNSTAVTSSRTPDVINQTASLFFETELLSNKVSLSAVGQRRAWNMVANNATIMSAGNTASSVESRDKEQDDWHNLLLTSGISRKVSANSYIEGALDYLSYRNDNDHHYRNIVSAQTTIDTSYLNSSKSTPIKIFVGDLVFRSSRDVLQYSLGAKYSNSFLRNKVFTYTYDKEVTIGASEDLSREENNYAAFVQGVYKGKEFQFNGGVRYELLNANLSDRTVNATIISTSQHNILPNIEISRKFKQGRELALIYNQRIERPKFQALAPFIVFVGPNTFYNGNVHLQSSLLTTYKLSFTSQNQSLYVQYLDFKNQMALYQPMIIPEENKHIIKPLNFDEAFVIDMAFSRNWIIGDINVESGAAVKHQSLEHKANHTSLSYDKVSVKVTCSFTYTTKTNYTFNFSGYYQSPNYSGIVLKDAPGQIDGFVKKKLKRHFAISVAATDIFNTNKWALRSHWREAYLSLDEKHRYETRTFKVSLSYDFGGSIKAIQSRISDERKRME